MSSSAVFSCKVPPLFKFISGRNRVLKLEGCFTMKRHPKRKESYVNILKLCIFFVAWNSNIRCFCFIADAIMKNFNIYLQSFCFVCSSGHHQSLWATQDESLSLVHTSDISISTRSIRKQSTTSPLGFAKTKQREVFFVSPFVLLLAYAWTMILCLWRSLCRRLGFIPLFCLLFCPYAYAYAIVWTRL